MKMPALLLAPVLLLALAACMPTRVPPPPPDPVPPAFKEGTPVAGSVAPTPVPDRWWTLFGDPQLDALQERLAVDNQNLRALAAQLESARAVVAASEAARFPIVNANAGATRSRPSQSTATTSQTLISSGTASLSASWELDLWGRLRLALEGATASAQASANDLAAARLSAQATLAQTWFSLRATDAQRAVIERSITGFRRSLELTQARFEGGVAARSDVLQAQTQLKTTQAQYVELGAQRAQLEHAIAVLVGSPPSAFGVTPDPRLPAPVATPQALPSTLLERRPDIAAARSRVEAAFAQIGVADAAFLPSVTLTASGGTGRSVISGLTGTPYRFWSAGTALAYAVLDAGQRRLASAQARASADAAVATWRQTVLTAFQEVEDNLALASRLQEEAVLQQEALDAAQRNVELTLEQYRAGTVSYLNVVVAQTTALNLENTLIVLRNRQLAAVNQLLKNIAGRWTPA